MGSGTLGVPCQPSFPLPRRPCLYRRVIGAHLPSSANTVPQRRAGAALISFSVRVHIPAGNPHSIDHRFRQSSDGGVRDEPSPSPEIARHTCRAYRRIMKYALLYVSNGWKRNHGEDRARASNNLSPAAPPQRARCIALRHPRDFCSAAHL